MIATENRCPRCGYDGIPSRGGTVESRTTGVVYPGDEHFSDDMRAEMAAGDAAQLALPRGATAQQIVDARMKAINALGVRNR